MQRSKKLTLVALALLVALCVGILGYYMTAGAKTSSADTGQMTVTVTKSANPSYVTITQNGPTQTVVSTAPGQTDTVTKTVSMGNTATTTVTQTVAQNPTTSATSTGANGCKSEC